MNDGAIGIFDSGVGGLKVLAAARRELPGENFIYIFDRNHAPYGNKSHRYVARRAEKVSKMLLSLNAKAVIVACNTATNVGIASLRKKFGVPFVGVEPPVKPAALDRCTGNVLVLTTALTAKQERFTELVKRYDDGHIIVAPQPTLAYDIERNFASLSDLKDKIDALLRPYDDKNIESVVLGCTHYYFIADMIKEHYRGTVKLYDALGGVTKRLKSVLADNDLFAENNIGKVKYIYI